MYIHPDKTGICPTTDPRRHFPVCPSVAAHPAGGRVPRRLHLHPPEERKRHAHARAHGGTPPSPCSRASARARRSAGAVSRTPLPCAQDVYSRDAPFRKYPRNAPTRQYKIYHRLLYPSHFLPFERNASLLRDARYEVQCQPRGCIERGISCTGRRRVMLSDLLRKSGCCPNWRSCISRLPSS